MQARPARLGRTCESPLAFTKHTLARAHVQNASIRLLDFRYRDASAAVWLLTDAGCNGRHQHHSAVRLTARAAFLCRWTRGPNEPNVILIGNLMSVDREAQQHLDVGESSCS